MNRMYGGLSYWSGCLAVVLLAFAILAVPTNMAGAAVIGGGGDGYSGQCPDTDCNSQSCVKAGDRTGTCERSANGTQCTCA